MELRLREDITPNDILKFVLLLLALVAWHYLIFYSSWRVV